MIIACQHVVLSLGISSADTYGVIQSIDVQHHSFGPLVVGAQEEVGLTLAGGSCCLGLFGLFFTGRLQNFIDLRGQQFGLPWRRTPLVEEIFFKRGERGR